MEEVDHIVDYLPYSFKNISESEYISFLTDVWDENYNMGRYQFSVLACHMVYMSFVYCSVWKIKQIRSSDFVRSLIGFNKDEEKGLLDAQSPFDFWTINESRIFRFLKLIGCQNDDIGKFTKIVQQRNDIAHCNGNLSIRSQALADTKVEEIMKQVQSIQNHMLPVISDCFEHFLLSSYNTEERAYIDTSDQIREHLIHEYYFSWRDIQHCHTFDMSRLNTNPGFAQISLLFEEFKTIYA